MYIYKYICRLRSKNRTAKKIGKWQETAPPSRHVLLRGSRCYRPFPDYFRAPLLASLFFFPRQRHGSASLSSTRHIIKRPCVWRQRGCGASCHSLLHPSLFFRFRSSPPPSPENRGGSWDLKRALFCLSQHGGLDGKGRMRRPATALYSKRPVDSFILLWSAPSGPSSPPFSSPARGPIFFHSSSSFLFFLFLQLGSGPAPRSKVRAPLCLLSLVFLPPTSFHQCSLVQSRTRHYDSAAPCHP